MEPRSIIARKFVLKQNEFSIQNLGYSSCRVRSIQRKLGEKECEKKIGENQPARPEARTERERQDDHVHASARESSRQALRQNLKASTTAQHHVHAHPAVGITSTEPGRKARPCKPGGRARPREIFETKTRLRLSQRGNPYTHTNR